MPIYSNRDLQLMVNVLTGHLTREQLQRLVRAIERFDGASIDAEWELIVLAGLARQGRVEHEPDLGSRVRVDFRFQCDGITLVGDVRTVSDRGYEEESPVEAFQTELFRRVRKRGIAAGGFHLEIGRWSRWHRGVEHVRAAVPRPSQYPEAFGLTFAAFLDRIALGPESTHEYRMAGPGFDVLIQVGLDKEHVTTHCPGYAVSYDVERNPLMNALRQKARQLKQVRSPGYRAIVICDGHADILRRRLSYSRAVDVDAVIPLFLRRHTSVDLVAVLSVEHEPSPSSPIPFSGPLRLRARVFENPAVAVKDAGSFIENLPNVLPRPRVMVVNAVAQLGWSDPRRGWTFRGGWSVQFESDSATLKISSRHLHGLLAGRVSPDEFQRESSNFAWTDKQRNMFATFLDRGFMIKRIEVVRQEHEDDDWLVFHFGSTDPAVTGPQVPGVDRDD